MNVALVLSGGVGSRFGSVVPKQYNLIFGKPVIDYVVEAVLKAKKIDRAVIAMDRQWIEYSELIKRSTIDIVANGNSRYESMKNGLDLIAEKFSCEKLIILDAVRPFVYPELIDRYIEYLDDNDVVITAEKITGGFTDINDSLLDRENYIITQSPEAFRFPLLYQNFIIDFPYQETAGMLPSGSKRLYYYGFKDNLKITYDFDLDYAELRMKGKKTFAEDKSTAFFDKNIFYTEGIKNYLLRIEPKKTRDWINYLYEVFPKIIDKWAITSFLPNQISRYGLVLLAKSREYGDVVVKLIPEFVNRYARELETIKLLSVDYMCPLLDYDDDFRVMLFKRISPARYATFEANKKLTDFYNKVFDEATLYTEDLRIKSIPFFYDELKEKHDCINRVTFLREEIERELRYAIRLYEESFSNSELYVVHGDLIDFNVLDDGDRWWGIDPNGFVAPIEIECVRFIRNDVRSHKDFGYEERFDLLIHSFSRFVDANRLVRMFIIDMAMCTYNSTFENETEEETRMDLYLIQIARDWLERNDNVLRSE